MEFAADTTRVMAQAHPAARTPREPPRFARVGNQARLRRLQAKLTIGAVDDPLEHEADAMAEQVMRMPEPCVARKASAMVQRACAACEKDEKLQLKSDGAAAPTSVSGETVQNVLATSGQPLDATTRAFFEPRFGADFSGVRLHRDERAADSARQIGAQAYAAGGDIVFGAGRYAPDSAAGRTLIAHELAHVIQQAAPTGPAATLRRQPEEAPSAPGTLDLAAADDLSAKNPKLAAFVAGCQRVLTASPKAAVVATAFWSSKSAFEGQGGTPDVMRTAAAARAKDVKAALVTLGIPAEAISDTQSDLNEGTAQGPEGAVRLVVLQTPLALPQQPAIDPATVAAPAQAPGAPLLDLDKDANPGTGNLALGELAKYQLAPKLKDPGGTVGVIAFVEDPGPVPAPDPGTARKDGAPPPDPAAARKQGEDRANTVRDTLIAGGVDAAFINADTRFAPPNDPRIGHVWVQFVPKTATAAAASPLDFSKFTTLQLQTPRFTFVLKVPDSLALKTRFVEGKISFSPGASLKLKPVPGIPGLEIGISGELTSLSSLVGSSSPAPATGGAVPPPASPPVKFSLSVAINGQGFKLEASTDVNLDNTQAALDNTPSALDNTPAGIHRGKITSGIYVTLIEPSIKYQIPSVVLNDLNSNGAKLQKAINALMSSPNPPAATQSVGGPPAAPAGPQSTASSVLDIATAMASIADAMDKIDKAKKEKVAPKFKIGAGVTNPIGPPGPGGTSSNQPVPFVGASGTF